MQDRDSHVKNLWVNIPWRQSQRNGWYQTYPFPNKRQKTIFSDLKTINCHGYTFYLGLTMYFSYCVRVKLLAFGKNIYEIKCCLSWL